MCVCLSGEGYWVGKASLRSWRQLALEQLEEDEHESKHSNGQTNGQGPHSNNCKGCLFFLLCSFMVAHTENHVTFCTRDHCCSLYHCRSNTSGLCEGLFYIEYQSEATVVGVVVLQQMSQDPQSQEDDKHTKVSHRMCLKSTMCLSYYEGQ